MAHRDPRAQYRHDLVQSLVKSAHKTFAKHEDVNSLVLSVAQYWNDEAEDEVHLHLTYSNRSTPLFSHRCRWEPTDEPDFCSYCHKGLPSAYDLRLSEGEAGLIESMEPYCLEGAHQEMSQAEAYLPYAIVRRDTGLELVGPPVRLWGARLTRMTDEPSAREQELLARIYDAPDDDGPRAVLADWWLEQGDKRGELVSLQLKGQLTPAERQREAELLEEHGPTLLGRLGLAVSMDGARFRRGLLHEAEVWFEPGEAASDPRWATVERLHFVHHPRLFPALRALRTVSGLSEEALQQAASGAHTYDVEDVAVSFPVAQAVRILDRSERFPRLRRVEGMAGERGELVALLGALPDAVRCVGVADGDPSWLPELLRALPEGRTLEWVSRPEMGRLTGWRCALSREGDLSRMRCVLDNLRGDSALSRVGRLLRYLPSEIAVELVPSPYYEPRPGDLGRLAAGEDEEDA
jgi:uncharacterized protein (TIGR02996 family)